jgi:uncharacterized protein (DUF1684 family)
VFVRSSVAIAVSALVAGPALRPLPALDPHYVEQIESSRKPSDEFLRSSKSPLFLVGRFGVPEGVSRIGSDPQSQIVLPDGAPKWLGVIERHGKDITLHVADGATVSVNGKPATGSVQLLVAESPKPSDRVAFGDFLFSIRPDGDEFLLLLRDENSPYLRSFKGTTWFPVNPAYRVTARFTPYEMAKTIAIADTAAQKRTYSVPGYLTFTIDRQELRLDPVVSGGNLFLMFRDRTSGKQTYGAGRFLEADMPKDGTTVLDFNKAYNPYCAYNPYASCPLPPQQNHLQVEIPAGETYQREH